MADDKAVDCWCGCFSIICICLFWSVVLVVLGLCVTAFAITMLVIIKLLLKLLALVLLQGLL